MNIGVIKFTIRIPANQSLKGKRKVVSSLLQKLRNRFYISVAEVACNDDLKMAILGAVFVSNSKVVINQLISEILRYLQAQAGNFILVDFNQEIIAGY
jgi:uncharacterized protein YlxP (DUF503 family)